MSAEELGRLGAILQRAESVGLTRKNGVRTLYRRTTTAVIELLLFTGVSEVLNLNGNRLTSWGAKSLYS